MDGPPKVAITPVELTPPWPPLEAWPQQKTQLFGNSEGLPAIRAKSSSQKTLIPISPKILEHPSVHTYKTTINAIFMVSFALRLRGRSLINITHIGVTGGVILYKFLGFEVYDKEVGGKYAEYNRKNMQT